MTTETMRSYHPRHGMLPAWAALLASPLAFFVSLQAGYSVVPYECGSNSPILLHLVSLGCLALSLSAGLLGYREWRRPEGNDGEEASLAPQSAFLGAIAVFLSALFSLIIFGQWYAGVFLNPCMR